MSDPSSVIEPIKKTLRGLVIATVLLYVVIAAGVAFTFNQSKKVENSLCDLRGDLQSRVEQTQNFLDHPEDFPAFNDPKLLALTQNQLDGQKRTINALSDLNC